MISHAVGMLTVALNMASAWDHKTPHSPARTNSIASLHKREMHAGYLPEGCRLSVAPDLKAAVPLLYDLCAQDSRSRAACQKRHFSGCAGDAIAKAVKAPRHEAAQSPGGQGSRRAWALAEGRAGLCSPALAVARHCCLWVASQVHSDLQRSLGFSFHAIAKHWPKVVAHSQCLTCNLCMHHPGSSYERVLFSCKHQLSVHDVTMLKLGV